MPFSKRIPTYTFWNLSQTVKMSISIWKRDTLRGDFEKDQILCFGFDRQLSLMLRNPVLDETDYWGKVNHSDCMKMTQDRRTMSASVKEEAVMKQVSRRRASVGPKCTFRIGKTTAGVGKKSVFYPKGEISSYGSGRRGRLLAATWGICNNNICTRRAGKLNKTRSRLAGWDTGCIEAKF